ncbi:hypothetical protein M513_11230 [Trichuris suis]|uniref:Uncharacterized protein n=1 Tax=Trichuris suis TaxID=68888 RepID=A0A085LSD1_9BILA|nr:hypothetical protein M513_11230 [Trichuris suis]
MPTDPEIESYSWSSQWSQAVQPMAANIVGAAVVAVWQWRCSPELMIIIIMMMMIMMMSRPKKKVKEKKTGAGAMSKIFRINVLPRQCSDVRALTMYMTYFDESHLFSIGHRQFTTHFVGIEYFGGGQNPESFGTAETDLWG